MEQGPRPDRDPKIHLIKPWAIPGEIIDDHKDQRHSEDRGGLGAKERKGGGLEEILTSEITTAYAIIEDFVTECGGLVKEGERENPIADEEERTE